MSETVVSRRRLFLLGGSALTLLGAAGCSKEPSSCNDVSGLSADEAKVRTTLEYVDRSPDLTKTCEKCQQWIAPAESSSCGGCKVLKGPVHPKGHCKVFVAKA
jgi:hypothetical protein